jgi:VanZ family protein
MKMKIFAKPLIWLAIICYGIYLPAGRLPKNTFLNIPHFDKIVHFVLFFVLCLLLFKPLKYLKTNHLLLAPVVSLILAALIELSQQWLASGRHSSINDFIANVAGILAALVIYSFMISDKKVEKYL